MRVFYVKRSTDVVETSQFIKRTCMFQLVHVADNFDEHRGFDVMMEEEDVLSAPSPAVAVDD